MGKKVKVGKQRRDKAYWSAKEIGYRSRASFKLIQLNRKFEFLQKSRVCIDLCAAPGSWMQVAKEHMPMSSLIVGVDLVPIKPIPGCIALVNDITTEKCRQDLKKELQTWKADIVLHDGAPNVGKSWIHDAYQQSLITLHAFKLATEFLMKDGTFVTKVFRSKDYLSLIYVFNQFFKKVHSTKPQASRAESAEIFVVCQGYKAPDEIDPKYFDQRFVFSDIEADKTAADKEILNPEKKKKAPAEGYEEGQTLLYKKAKASEFIMDNKPIHILNNFNEIVLDEPRIYKHKKTTKEVRECCKDIRVLGMKELKLLKKWRDILRTEFLEAEKKAEEEGKPKEEEQEKNEDSDDSDEELKELDKEIASLKEEERLALRRKKKKELKSKRKLAQKIDLKMVIPGDKGPTLEEEGLFSITEMESGKDLDRIHEQEPERFAESSDEDSDDESSGKKKVERYSREGGKLDKEGMFYKDSESEEEGSEAESDSDKEDLGLEEDERDDVNEEEVEKLNDPSQNPLLVELEQTDRESRKRKKADLWFDKDVFKGIEDDENLEEAEIEQAIKAIKNKGGKIMTKEKKEESEEESEEEDAVMEEPKKKRKKKYESEEEESSDEDSDSDSDSDSDYDMQKDFYKSGGGGAKTEKDGFEVVPQEKKKKRAALTPEELAMGQEMIKSKKRKRDLMDGAWNRFMFNERNEDLPDWFVREEQQHMRRIPQMDPETVEYYKQKQKEINVKTIKKVVEAKARKKRKMAKKMEKAKKKAAVIMENNDLGSREKANEISRLYKKAQNSQKKEVQYVVAKKHQTTGKRASRPANVKGPYRQVDTRMKKDKRNTKIAAKKDKRRGGSKGKAGKGRPAGRGAKKK